MRRSDANMFFFNGQRETAGYVRVDGLSANLGLPADAANVPLSAGATPALTANGAANATVSAIAVNEAQFLLWQYRGDLAATPGRQISFTTKGGTNKFHGSAFSKFDGAFLRANDWFANSRGLARPAANRNNFGGALGGQIIDNKLFYFGSYEGLRGRDAAFTLTDVPALAARRNADVVLRPLLNAFPEPNGAARSDGLAEFAAAFANPSRHDFASARIDGNAFDVYGRFWGRYTYSASNAAIRANGFAPNVKQQLANRAQSLSGAGQYFRGYKGVEIRANYSQARLAQGFGSDAFGGAQPLAAATSGGLYRYELLGRGAALAFGPARENLLRQLNLNGDFTINKGDHDWHLGGDFRRLWLTLQPQTTETGLLLADILTPQIRSARLQAFSRAANINPRFDNFSIFAQDDWRINRQFTLNLGLRWELSPPPLAGAERLWRTDYRNFAPRIGVAWGPGEDGKNLIRLGLGWYYELANTGAAQVFGQSSPFVQSWALTNAPLNSLTPNIANGAPNNQIRLSFAPHLRTPRVRQLYLGYMREITRGVEVTASYFEAKGRRLWLTRSQTDLDSRFALARVTDNGALSNFRAFNLRFQLVRRKGVDALLQYSQAKARDNYTPDTLAQSYAVSADAAQDYGPADFDARHSLRGFAAYSMPREYENAWLSSLLRNWQISSRFHWRGATRVNVVHGRLNGFGLTYLRPDVRPGVSAFISNTGRLRQFNAAAFALPTNATNGNLARNSLRGYGFAQVDASLSRSFSLTQETSLTLRADVYNLLNHANFLAPSGFDASLGTQLADGSFTPNTAFGQTRATAGQDTSAGANFLAPYRSGGARSARLAISFKF